METQSYIVFWIISFTDCTKWRLGISSHAKWTKYSVTKDSRSPGCRIFCGGGAEISLGQVQSSLKKMPFLSLRNKKHHLQALSVAWSMSWWLDSQSLIECLHWGRKYPAEIWLQGETFDLTIFFKFNCLPSSITLTFSLWTMGKKCLSVALETLSAPPPPRHNLSNYIKPERKKKHLL